MFLNILCMCVHVCVHVCMCVHVCVCVCMCVFTSIDSNILSGSHFTEEALQYLSQAPTQLTKLDFR